MIFSQNHWFKNEMFVKYNRGILLKLNYFTVIKTFFRIILLKQLFFIKEFNLLHL